MTYICELMYLYALYACVCLCMHVCKCVYLYMADRINVYLADNHSIAAENSAHL